MDNADALEKLHEALSSRPEIRIAIVFGSMAGVQARQDSDLDLAILADHELTAAERTELIELGARCTGRPVDLIDLHSAGVVALRSALLHGRRFICRDRAAYEQLVRRMLYDTADFLPYRERMLRERRQQWIR